MFKRGARGGVRGGSRGAGCAVRGVRGGDEWGGGGGWGEAVGHMAGAEV